VGKDFCDEEKGFFYEESYFFYFVEMGFCEEIKKGFDYGCGSFLLICYVLGSDSSFVWNILETDVQIPHNYSTLLCFVF
jgi:hypothetical protein